MLNNLSRILYLEGIQLSKNATMNNLYIRMSEETPLINLNSEKGNVIMIGRSLPEDCNAFYAPVRKWMEAYVLHPNTKTKVDFALEYFNTGSSAEIIRLFTRLEELQAKGISDIEVNWYYEENDIDMLETGEDFMELFSVPIKTIPVDRIEALSN